MVTPVLIITSSLIGLFVVEDSPAVLIAVQES